MRKKLTQYLVVKCLENRIIDSGEEELYNYGIFQLVNYSLFLGIACLIGFFLGGLLDILSFLGLFFLLRSVSGGIHFKQSTSCLIVSILTVICGKVFISVVLSAEWLLFIAGITAFFNFWYPFIDNQNHRISIDEKKRSLLKKKKLICLYVCLFFIPNLTSIICYVLLLNFLSLSLGIANNSKKISFLL